jgi:hypothetical protein
MASLINTLDSISGSKIEFGVNGHLQYSWNHSQLIEMFVQFHFQCIRLKISTNWWVDEKTGYDVVSKFHKKFKDLIEKAKKDNNYEILNMIGKYIAFSRDIEEGKGEYMLSYIMLYEWSQHFPEEANELFENFITFTPDNKKHPFGSFKDVKGFIHCMSNFWMLDDNAKYEILVGSKKPKNIFSNRSIYNEFRKNNQMVKFCCGLLNKQIREDEKKFLEGKIEEISLAAKWVPRQTSTYSCLFDDLAIDYFYNYILTAKSDDSKCKATKKCFTKYRQLISKLNKALDTTQIKQCSGKWSQIDFNRVTSLTFSKQKKAFSNIKERKEDDRKECAENFRSFIEERVKTNSGVAGKRVSMEYFTKTALELGNNCNSNKIERDLLQQQWVSNSTQNNALGKFIAMVDVSGSMYNEPLYVANALGIRIAEKSALGKRVLTFSAEPKWVNLEDCSTFIEMTKRIVTDSGFNTNFHKALKLILTGISLSKLPYEEVSDMVLVILSDMQIDQGDWNYMDPSMNKLLIREYAEMGMNVYGKPLRPPHILFWNLRTTNGFPAISVDNNCSMMSGYSPVLLNNFVENGFEAFKNLNPFESLKQIIDKERYNHIKLRNYNI